MTSLTTAGAAAAAGNAAATVAAAILPSQNTFGRASAAKMASISSDTCPRFIPPLNSKNVDRIESHFGKGTKMKPLDPIGAAIYGVNLKNRTNQPPPDEVVEALEAEMASRGFLVFKGQDLDVDELLAVSKWWGGKDLHSTHGVHPATPGRNRHIFRLSNDQNHGILGVGPQWHNDGSFVPDVFSHVGYYMVRAPEKGGGTYFSHQGGAYDALPPERQAYWERLTSVNSNSGVLHPAVHTHPISGRKSLWLHLGMTGGVLEKNEGDSEDGKTGFRLLNALELTHLMNEYNDIMNAGLDEDYGIRYQYETGDLIFIDNYAVGHKASPEAHLPASEQGLRIMHRVTVQAEDNFAPHFGLPQFANINGPSPDPGGVWSGGGVGFRWDDKIHMQN